MQILNKIATRNGYMAIGVAGAVMILIALIIMIMSGSKNFLVFAGFVCFNGGLFLGIALCGMIHILHPETRVPPPSKN